MVIHAEKKRLMYKALKFTALNVTENFINNLILTFLMQYYHIALPSLLLAIL